MLLNIVIALLFAYLLGSLPIGYLLIRLYNGQDVRQVGSGRTGSTNVLRVGGAKAAIMTGVLDVLKAASAVWAAEWLVPSAPWVEVAAGLLAILGHNYSIFLGFKGGAGGAPTIGGAFALWPPSILLVVPIGAAVWYFVGYASVATMSFSVVITAALTYSWYKFGGAGEYVFYGIGALIICLWALRPNIKRLIAGSERVHGWRAKRMKQS